MERGLGNIIKRASREFKKRLISGFFSSQHVRREGEVNQSFSHVDVWLH